MCGVLLYVVQLSVLVLGLEHETLNHQAYSQAHWNFVQQPSGFCDVALVFRLFISNGESVLNC